LIRIKVGSPSRGERLAKHVTTYHFHSRIILRPNFKLDVVEGAKICVLCWIRTHSPPPTEGQIFIYLPIHSSQIVAVRGNGSFMSRHQHGHRFFTRVSYLNDAPAGAQVPPGDHSLSLSYYALKSR
jgi:hypothetical protein